MIKQYKTKLQSVSRGTIVALCYICILLFSIVLCSDRLILRHFLRKCSSKQELQIAKVVASVSKCSPKSSMAPKLNFMTLTDAKSSPIGAFSHFCRIWQLWFTVLHQIPS